jgi:hypothetical protein
VAKIGDESAAAGHAVSAREAYLRASNYYRTSYLPLYGTPVDPRLVEAFERETDIFQKAAPLFDPPIEVLDIPLEDSSLPAYFVKVDDSGKPRPMILQTNGYDSTINEMYFSHASGAIRRVYNFLCFDGPGPEVRVGALRSGRQSSPHRGQERSPRYNRRDRKLRRCSPRTN